MSHHIDVGVVLRRSVCDLYSNLVTRPTGAAVRTEIEQQLTEVNKPSVTVIDFSNVSLLDFSCADEVVAKLVLRFSSPAAPAEAYFMFRGISEAHMDAIESVLDRHRIAIVVQDEEGRPMLIGRATEEERDAWEAVGERRRLPASDTVRNDASGERDMSPVLDRLHERRLLIRLDDEYVSLGEMLT